MLGRKLEYLIALAKEAHFARAAAACHVSQPTLSAAIQQLETELGIQIVKRGQRFQGLTEQGELVLAAAQHMAIECDRLHRRLRDQRNDFSGTLRIGVLGSTIPLLKTFTLPFQRQFPNVNLRVMVQSAFDTQQAFEESSLDIAITYLDQKLRHYCRTQVLYTEEYELLIRKGTALSGRAVASWEDLRQLPLCLLSPDMNIFGTRESEILNETLSKTPHIVTNAIWMVMDHVGTGKWASVLPRPVRIMIADDDKLEAIPLPTTGKTQVVAIAIPRRKPASPMAEAFFKVATSDDASKTIHNLMRSTTGMGHGHQPGPLRKGAQPPSLVPLAKAHQKERNEVSKKVIHVVPGLLLSMLLPALIPAQAPPAAPAKPDSAEVKQHIEKAKKIAGTNWAGEANFFCLMPRANSPNDPLIEPTKIFDNVYAVGRSGTLVYAITTSDGIILIDSGYANEEESVLLPGMKKLGLDPAKIKYVIVTHGHGDHFGGAAYLQEHYGAHVVLSQADWDLMLNPPPAAPKGGGKQGKAPAAPVTPPKKDLVAMEGQPITLGGEKVTPVMIPGHTPGSIGLIFEVIDRGKKHTAALFGGTILLAGAISDAGLQQYLHSIDHFKEITKQAKVDVELQNHPLYDGLEERLAKLRDRKPGAPNPFIVGKSNYQKFLDVQAECMRAAVARRAP